MQLKRVSTKMGTVLEERLESYYAKRIYDGSKPLNALTNQPWTSLWRFYRKSLITERIVGSRRVHSEPHLFSSPLTLHIFTAGSLSSTPPPLSLLLRYKYKNLRFGSERCVYKWKSMWVFKSAVSHGNCNCNCLYLKCGCVRYKPTFMHVFIFFWA